MSGPLETVITVLLFLAIVGAWVTLYLYFSSLDALEKERRRQARAEEFAQAQRKITHGGRSNANP